MFLLQSRRARSESLTAGKGSGLVCKDLMALRQAILILCCVCSLGQISVTRTFFFLLHDFDVLVLTQISRAVLHNSCQLTNSTNAILRCLAFSPL